MHFPTTRWDDLAKASLHGNTEARAALDDLCRRYWQPVNGFIRWRGFDEASAADLTQDFFLNFLQTRSWRRADRLRGSFRTFLLGALTHRLHKAHAHQTRLKRGGGAAMLSLAELDEGDGDGPASAQIPPVEAAHFDRAWAVNVLDTALKQVRADYRERGKEALYEKLKCFLITRDTPPTYQGVAQSLQLGLGAVKTEIHRLRLAFRTAMRLEIGRTVSAPHEVEEELRHLRQTLLRPDAEFGVNGET